MIKENSKTCSDLLLKLKVAFNTNWVAHSYNDIKPTYRKIKTSREKIIENRKEDEDDYAIDLRDSIIGNILENTDNKISKDDYKSYIETFKIERVANIVNRLSTICKSREESLEIQKILNNNMIPCYSCESKDPNSIFGKYSVHIQIMYTDPHSKDIVKKISNLIK